MYKRQVLARLTTLVARGTAPDMMICNYVYEHVEDNTQRVMHYRNVFPRNRVFGWEQIGRFRPSQYLLMHSVIYLSLIHIYHTYLERFASQRNTVFHMKELWSYLSRLFVGAEGKPLKRIRKAADSPAYEAAVDQMFFLPLREEAEWGPGAPL